MRRLRSKVSLERITASLGASSDVPPLPHTPPQFLGNKPESSRKRDELWTAFRSIDADLPKYVGPCPYSCHHLVLGLTTTGSAVNQHL